MPSLDYDAIGVMLEQALSLSPTARGTYLAKIRDEHPALAPSLCELLQSHDAASEFFDHLGERVVSRALETVTRQGAVELQEGGHVGHYQILEAVGRGGMGVVFKAHDLRLERIVALKVLPLHLSADPTAKARFITEAKAASALDHPNIGVVHEFGETAAGRLFMVMAYYDGETLEQRNQRDRMTVREAIDLAHQIGSALAAAHRKTIIHRDVKSSNILLTPDGTAKLLDFGIAKLGHLHGADEAGPLGTIAYMSPEQTAGMPVDHRSDLWSLGVVLYESLTGAQPFRGSNEAAVIDAIRHAESVPLEALRPDVPADLAKVVSTCLAKRADERYSSADDLLKDLDAVHRRVAEAPRRRRMQLSLAGGAGIVALVGIITGMSHLERRFQPALLSTTAAVAENEPRVAVLPLASVDSNPEERIVADGITADLIAELSRQPGLTTIARSTVMRYRDGPRNYRQIGEELDVQAVISGTLLTTADGQQIRMQLFEPGDPERSRWTQTFGFSAPHATAVADMATRVIERLGLEPEPPDPYDRQHGGINVELYALYLKGRYFLDQSGGEAAIKARDYFQQALDLEPTFARAWAGFADAHYRLVLYASAPADQAYPRMKAAAERALQIDPDLPEAHVSIGIALSHYYWDFEGAGHHYRRAIALGPGNAEAHRLYAEYLRYQGRFDEAVHEARRADALDPLSPLSGVEIGVNLYLDRQYEQAATHFLELLEAAPRFTYARFFLALCRVQQGDYDGALGTLAEIGPELERMQDAATLRSYIHAISGREALARAALDELRSTSTRHLSPWHPAVIHLGLGERDRALELLEQAYRERAWQVRLLPVEPLFDELRSEPRFLRLTEAVLRGAPRLEASASSP